MENIKLKSKRTLLASVLISSPGPLVIGIGAILGGSVTQLSDFIRRTIELVTMIVSLLAFKSITKNKEENEEYKKKLEKIVGVCIGIALLIGGTSMFLLTMFSENREHGNIWLGLIIVFLGVLVNGFFWFRYSRLYNKEDNKILLSQAHLYRTKTIVDIGITTVLLFLIFLQDINLTQKIDIAGSSILAGYVFFMGINSMKKSVIKEIGE